MTHLIERFTEHLKRGKYNSMTIAAYRNAIFVFYNHFRDYPQSKITEDVIANYLVELALKKNNPQETIQAGKAIKLFFEVIFSKKLNIKASGEYKNTKEIEILSLSEINCLFSSIKNLKHKTLLIVIYNSGLRISEAINLMVSDVDFKNKILNIIDEETKIKRAVGLSSTAEKYLKQYFDKYSPDNYLFPGEKGNAYSSRNIQLFFQSALKNSNIGKYATVHTLRHSFAVHSLEMGIDLHLIKEILGHKYLQTTSVYTSLANIKIEKLRSPIENLQLED